MSDDELDIEAEVDEAPHVEFDISVSPSDPPLEMLANQVRNGDIIVPFYQRKYVWKIEQASKLIESFLMGLPVPQIFLYVNEDDQLEIIDGQQRVMSVAYFMEGYFGEADNNGRRQVFKLKGLSERSSYNGLTFQELSDKDRRRLRNCTLRAIHIKQLRPNANNDSAFHIFERLNTGGTQLKPQEIRNAVYRGKIVDELRRLNDLAAWQAILGLKRPDKNQKDVELILRILSLFEAWGDYEKPMIRHLNNAMKREHEFTSDRARLFAGRFEQAADAVSRAIEKPFRPYGVINSSVLEAVMLAVMENQVFDMGALRVKYDQLLADDEFRSLIRGSTADTLILRKRNERAHQIIA